MSHEPDPNNASNRRRRSRPHRGASPPDVFSLVGVTLDGRYLIEKELDRGGVGVVYLARDKPELLSRQVVVKVLLEQSLRNPWVVNKFRHEIEALSRLDHPGIVGIFDTGELPNGMPYIVMQYVEGETLLSALRPEGMDLARAAEIIRQMGCALDEAHELQIIHRDLKPANVMLRQLKSGEEQVKVIDFGIAKVKNSLFAPDTTTAVMAGTLVYVSPEQLRGEKVTTASDIYSLGLIAYELVTGQKPFNPDTLGELLDMQKKGVRIKPTDLCPQLPEAAEAAIMQALSYAPRKRQQKASEFGNAFAAALNVHVSGPRVWASPAGPTPGQEERSHRSFKLGAVAALFGVALLGLLAWFMWPSAPERDLEARSIVGTASGGSAAAGVPQVEEGRQVADAGAATEGDGGTAAAPPERSLVFWLEVQRMRGGVADGKPIMSVGSEVFASGWQFRFAAQPQQDGSLYLINEGPKSDGSVGYWILYPTQEDNGGRPQLEATRKFQTRLWNQFDQNTGSETIWIVWSEQPLAQLDALVKEAASRNFEVTGPEQIDALKALVNDPQLPRPELELSKDKERATLKVRGTILVHPLALSHKPY